MKTIAVLSYKKCINKMKMNKLKINKTAKSNFITYGIVIAAFIIVQILVSAQRVQDSIPPEYLLPGSKTPPELHKYTAVQEVLSSGWKPVLPTHAIVFAVLIVVLLVKPTGILGKQVQEKV